MPDTQQTGTDNPQPIVGTDDECNSVPVKPATGPAVADQGGAASSKDLGADQTGDTGGGITAGSVTGNQTAADSDSIPGGVSPTTQNG